MILTMQSTLGRVFTVYAIFWVVALIVLFFAIGALTRRGERGSGGSH